MLPVGLSALVLNASLIGMKGVQAVESTAGSARTKNSRMPGRPLVGFADCACRVPRAQDQVKAPFGQSDDGVFSLGALALHRRPARRPPSRRLAGGPRVWPRQNLRSIRGTIG